MTNLNHTTCRHFSQEELDSISPTSVFGRFKGSYRSDEALEMEIYKRVPRRWFRDSARRLSERWWDYRTISAPRSCFYLIELLRDVYRTEISKLPVFGAKTYEKRVKSRFHNVYNGKHLWNGAEILEDAQERDWTIVWNLMMTADELGMPYETYLNLASKVVCSYWNKPMAPQPTNFYNISVIDEVYAKWEEMIASTLILAKHPIYKAENYRELPVQKDYIKWLAKEVRRRGSTPLVAEVVYNNPQIPIDQAEPLFGEEVMRRAKKFDLSGKTTA